MKKVRKGWVLVMTLVLLSALLPAWAAQSFSAVKLPTESVKKGGAASAAFLAAKGVYSSWENSNTGFTVDAQYGFYPSATDKTKITVLGQTSSKAFHYIQGITGHLYGMTEETYAGFDARTASRGNIGWKGTNFKIYNTATGRYDQIDIRVTITDWDAVDNPAYLFLQTTNARPSFNMYRHSCDIRIRYEFLSDRRNSHHS